MSRVEEKREANSVILFEYRRSLQSITYLDSQFYVYPLKISLCIFAKIKKYCRKSTSSQKKNIIPYLFPAIQCLCFCAWPMRKMSKYSSQLQKPNITCRKQSSYYEISKLPNFYQKLACRMANQKWNGSQFAYKDVSILCDVFFILHKWQIAIKQKRYKDLKSYCQFYSVRRPYLN